MTDPVTAIDDALDTGVAADDDPLTRELQERRHVCVDARKRPLVELRESLGLRQAGERHGFRERLVHALSTDEARIHHEFHSPTLK